MTCAKTRDKSAGGCAFRGARMALQPIADCLHLAHGPVTCQGLPWEVRPTASSGPALHRASPVTDMDEMAVIHGGAPRLRRSLNELANCTDAAAIFVYQTCVPAIIGDDIAQICTEATARLGRPVIAVDIPGFAGNRDDGSRAAADILLDQVIGQREPERLTDTDINLIGEANVAAECQAITALLAQAGIRVLASIPGDGRFDAIAGAHRARAAISLCSQSLGGLAAKMRARYGIAFIDGSFHGRANTARTLRGIAALLAAQGGPAALPERVAAVLKEAEQRQQRQLAPLLPYLAGKRALLLTGGFKVWGMVDLLRELGLEVVGASVQKTSKGERQRVAARLGADLLWDGLPQDKLRRVLATGAVDVVLAGSGFAKTCQRAGVVWIDINHERRFALSGYDGQVAVATALAQALRLPAVPSPAPAPWRQRP